MKSITKYSIYSWTIAMMLCLQNSVVVSQETGRTIINISIPKELSLDTFSYSYTQAFEQQTFRNQRISGNVKKQNDSFQIFIDSKIPIFYIYLTDNDTDFPDNSLLRLLAKTRFAVTSEMEMNMDIKSDTILFSGRDAAIIECQTKLSELTRYLTSRGTQLNHVINIESSPTDSISAHRRMIAYLTALDDLTQTTLDSGLQIIKQFRLASKSSIWEQITYDWIGKIKFNQINKMNATYALGHRFYEKPISDYYNSYIMSESLPYSVERYIVESHEFARYLYYKALSDLSYGASQTGYKILPEFATVIKLLSERTSGTLFEQSIFAGFLHRNAKSGFDHSQYKNISSLISHPNYKAYVDRMASAKSNDLDGFNFSLADVDDNIITPDNFAGKAVVLDFWFTGCRGCRALYERMKPVRQEFENDTSVIFVSISIDRSREKWLNSIKEGKYTDSTHVNLWTGPLHSQADIIMHYQINAYPTLIILDGENRIIAYNPPGPFTEFDTSALISLINKAKE